MWKWAMTKFERQTLLKARTPGTQGFLCKQCYVKETRDSWAQDTLTGTCDKCKRGPIGVIPWQFDAPRELHKETGWQ